MARRGRPRTDRPRLDHGTPELRAKRLFAIGPERPGWPKPNPEDGESALGVLLWRGSLAPTYEMSKRMYDAGVAFAGKWILVYPKSFPGNTLRGLQPGSTSAADVDEARRVLTEMSKELNKYGRGVFDAVVNCCVYNSIQPRKFEKLRTGLCRLIEWNNSARRAA